METSQAMQAIKSQEQHYLAGLDISYKDKEKIQIQYVEYLGEGKETKNEYLKLVEVDSRKEPPTVLYKYFDKEGNQLGIKKLDENDNAEWIGLREDEEWTKIKDEIDMNEAKKEEELQQIAESLGIKKEDIKDMAEIDLVQKIAEKQEEKEEDKDEKEKDDDSKEEQEEVTEEEAEKEFGDFKKEINVNATIDSKGHTLGSELGLKEYEKLEIINSDKLNRIKDEDGKSLNNQNPKFAVVGVRTNKEGKKIVEKVPDSKLKMYQGMNNEAVKFDDNDEVTKDSKATVRFVNPKTNKGLAIEQTDQQMKVYYQGGIDREDNTAVMERVEDTHTGRINTQTKEIFNSNHGVYQAKKINEETELHKDDDKIDRENADGNLETTTDHIHEINKDSKIIYDGKVMTVEEVANLPRFKVSPEYFAKLYNEKAKEVEGEEEIDLDDVYEDIEEDLNDQIQGNQTRG